jgi:hypothetical protein
VTTLAPLNEAGECPGRDCLENQPLSFATRFKAGTVCLPDRNHEVLGAPYKRRLSPTKTGCCKVIPQLGRRPVGGKRTVDTPMLQPFRSTHYSAGLFRAFAAKGPNHLISALAAIRHARRGAAAINNDNPNKPEKRFVLNARLRTRDADQNRQATSAREDAQQTIYAPECDPASRRTSSPKLWAISGVAFKRRPQGEGMFYHHSSEPHN